jgi:hypothetical protein
LIQPYFDYCSPLWDICNKTVKIKLSAYWSPNFNIV